MYSAPVPFFDTESLEHIWATILRGRKSCLLGAMGGGRHLQWWTDSVATSTAEYVEDEDDEETKGTTHHHFPCNLRRPAPPPPKPKIPQWAGSLQQVRDAPARLRREAWRADGKFTTSSTPNPRFTIECSA